MMVAESLSLPAGGRQQSGRPIAGANGQQHDDGRGLRAMTADPEPRASRENLEQFVHQLLQVLWWASALGMMRTVCPRLGERIWPWPPDSFLL